MPRAPRLPVPPDHLATIGAMIVPAWAVRPAKRDLRMVTPVVHAAGVSMELDTLVGLPAHPLLVHAAVILVPLAVIALAITGWSAA